MRATVTRRYPISLVHQIPEDYVGEETARLHGHDFKVEVTIEGARDPHTGQIFDRKILDKTVHKTLLQPYNMSLINEHFAHGTGEVLAIEFFKKLRASPLGSAVRSVQIVETRNNRFQGFANEPVEST